MKITWLILALCAMIAGIALFSNNLTGDKKMDANLQNMLDERDVINVVNSIGIEADRRNWNEVQNAFADNVLLDYSSMGAPIETLKPAQIVASWKTILPGFKATQHSITNHQVTIRDSEADCFSYVTALHYLPNRSKADVWRVVGFYEHHLIKTRNGWRVDRVKLTAKIIDGNLELPKLAATAVAQR